MGIGVGRFEETRAQSGAEDTSVDAYIVGCERNPCERVCVELWLNTILYPHRHTSYVNRHLRTQTCSL